MGEKEFDLAFSKFLDDEHCELVSETLYQLIRSAFAAGWNAAKGSDIERGMNIEAGKE